MKKKILVVDGSALVRRYVSKLLEEAGYEVKSAKNLQDTLNCLKEENFSLVLVDLEDLQEVKTIVEHCSTRVVVMGSLAPTQQQLFSGFEDSIVGYIQKPQESVDIAKIAPTILEKIQNALLSPIKSFHKKTTPFKTHNTSIDSSIEMGFVLIGSSTGGPRLIEKICKTLPKNYPHAVCVVQHMPVEFTANFAKRLDSLSAVEVIEAQEDLELQPGRVIIAKGGKHLHFRKKLNTYTTKLIPNTMNRFFVPSVDEMFFSAAAVLPAQRILAVELTGIGDDGADGMVALRKKGAYTIAESEKSAVVYGMPKEAYERGGAQKVLEFNDILDEIIRYGQNNANNTI